MTPITYISDQPGDYAKALDGADNLSKLMQVAHDWRELAEDAYEAVAKMTGEDFIAWRKGLAEERRGVFAGEEFYKKFADVLMPKLMFKVSAIAIRFGAPWGCAYLRLKETGNLEKALA